VGGKAVLAAALVLAGVASWSVPAQALPVVNRVRNLGTNQVKDTSATTLQVSLGTSVAVNDRVVVGFATDVLAGDKVTVLDSRGNTYAVDADVTNTGRVRLLVFSANVTTALVRNDWVRASFNACSPATCARAMVVSVYSGTQNYSPVVDQTATNVSSAATTSFTSGATAATTRPVELVLGAFGVEGPNTDTFSVGSGYTLDRRRGSTGGAADSNISAALEWKEVSATGAQTATASNNNARHYAAAVVTYRAAPTKLVFSSGPGGSIPNNTCTTTPFVLKTRSTANGDVPPTGTTVVELSSDSPVGSYTLYSDASCSTVITDRRVTFTTSTHTTSIYLKSNDSGTHTLTAAKVSGPDTLSNGTRSYTISACSQNVFVVTLPDQTFTEGLCNTGTPSQQVANQSFELGTVRATDGCCNTTTGYKGSKTLTFSGPGTGGDGSLPTYTTSVSFTGGVSTTTLTTTLRKAETVAINVAQGTTYTGTSSPLTVVFPSDTTAVTVGNSPGYATRGPGTFIATLTNGTGGSITQVRLDAPTGWSLSGGSVSPSTGWTVDTSGLPASMRFTTSLGVLGHGSSATFTLTSTGGTYRDVGVDTTDTFNVDYAGFQEDVLDADFLVRVPIGNVVLPAVTRGGATGNRPRFYWSNADENQPHAGVLVVRGSGVPVDKTTYSVGSAIGGSTVVCVDDGSGTTCDEPSDQTGAVVYGFYNYDAARVYATGIRLSVPAKPAAGFLYKHETMGLTAPGSRPHDTGTSVGGFASFAANDHGLFFVKTDGTEKRRAVLTDSAISRRAVAIQVGSTSGPFNVFAADMATGPGSGLAYKVDPSSNAAPATASVGKPVSCGVSGMFRRYATTMHATYPDDVLVVATNDASGNFVRGLASDLTTLWEKPLGDDAVTNEPVPVYASAILLVPVGAGGGGIYGLDLSQAASPYPPRPAGWSSDKILSGTTFKAMCRRQLGGVFHYCGATNGTVYAFTPTSPGTPLEITILDAPGCGVPGACRSIQSVIPFNGGLVYTTRSGRVGRVNFNGSAFTLVWDVGIPGSTVISPAMVDNLAGKVYVGAMGALHKLALVDGAAQGSVAVDGDRVSELTLILDYPLATPATGTLMVQTDAATIWGIPLF
jgi:hypothetical protein